MGPSKRKARATNILSRKDPGSIKIRPAERETAHKIFKLREREKKTKRKKGRRLSGGKRVTFEVGVAAGRLERTFS